MFLSLVQQYARSLKNLDAIMGKAAKFLVERKLDPDHFFTLRLAPDMYTFAEQVQSACEAAKNSAALMAGRDAPKFHDEERTFEDLRGRIRRVVAYLDAFTEADFAKVTPATRVRIPFPQGKGMLAYESAVQRAMPNFFFHVTVAYAILRHNGVQIGKSDYLGVYDTFDL